MNGLTVLQQLIRHIANLGLLLAFATLAVTGVMSFVLPFSITTARIHIVFGLATIVLVGMHLATRVSYFTRIARQSVALKSSKKPQVPRVVVAGVVVVWAGLLAGSLYDLRPVGALIGVGYEARHRAEIFRAAPQTVYEQVGPTNRIATVSQDGGELVIAVEIQYAQGLDAQPAAAVWAQTTGVPGRMIQTLFVDQALAYSDTPSWNGTPTPRHAILPIWRFAYTAVNGIDPIGEADAVTSATPKHSYSVEGVLKSDEEQIVVCLEINAFGDANAAYPDQRLGQPSVLYTALIDLTAEQDYYLMSRTAHGGGAERNGNANYNFDGVTSAKHLVEKVLVHIQRPGRDAR